MKQLAKGVIKYLLQQLSRIQLNQAPLYLCSNLTENSRFIAYLTYYTISNVIKICIINKKTKVEEQVIHTTQEVPTSLRFLPNDTLVLTAVSGYTIYDANHKFQIIHNNQNILQHDIERGNYYCGSAYLTCQNKATLYAIGYLGKISFFTNKEYFGINCGDDKPTCLCSLDDELLFGTQDGRVEMYQCLTETTTSKQMDLVIGDKYISVLCCEFMERKGNSTLIIVGDSIGRVTIIDGVKHTKFAEINCHLKHLMGLAINAEREEFITVSEDSYVNVWSVTSVPSLVLSKQLIDHAIVGVTGNCYVGSYDLYELCQIEYE